MSHVNYLKSRQYQGLLIWERSDGLPTYKEISQKQSSVLYSLYLIDNEIDLS